METYMQMLGRLAKSASREAAKLGTKAKNRGLLAVANELVEERELILQENAKDIEAAKVKGVKQSLIDRLALTEQRIEDMAEGLRQIAAPVSYTHLDVYKRQDKDRFPGTDMFCRNRNLQSSGVLVLFGRSKTDESGIA